ncbi:MAG: hypothetical protein FWH51_02420 [Dehalococcoidia bacterium]|nr:hypothetical protein [Dehalococcoidia bacterium]
MRKFRSVLLKPLALALVVAIALVSVIPVSAEGPNDKTGTDSGRVWPAFQILDLTDGTVPLAPRDYEAEKWYNENRAGKPISDEEWEAGQLALARVEAAATSFVAPMPTLTDLPADIVTIDIGDNTRRSNTTLLSANYGDDGDNAVGNAAYYHTYNIATRTNYAKVTMALQGKPETWAYTGAYFQVTGTGSMNATIVFDGNAFGYLYAPGTPAAQWIVRAELVDVATNTVIAYKDAYNSRVAFGGSANVGGRITSSNCSFGATLYAGNSYFARLVTFAIIDAPIPSVLNTIANVGDSGYSTYWSYIDIQW